jgi:hypothetical protein
MADYILSRRAICPQMAGIGSKSVARIAYAFFRRFGYRKNMEESLNKSA